VPEAGWDFYRTLEYNYVLDIVGLFDTLMDASTTPGSVRYGGNGGDAGQVRFR